MGLARTLASNNSWDKRWSKGMASKRVQRWWGKCVTWFRFRLTSNDLVAQAIPYKRQFRFFLLLRSPDPDAISSHTFELLIVTWVLYNCSAACEKMKLNVVLFSKFGSILFQMCLLPHPLARLLELLFYKLMRNACRIPKLILLTSLHNICETDSGNATEFVIRRLELYSYQSTDCGL